MIARLTRAFGLVSIVVAVFYAGELVWNECERGVHELVGATPAPDWAFLLPKVVAIALVLGAMLLAGVAVAIGVQAARSGGLGPGLAPERYVWDYLLPRAYDWTLLAVLAVFFQAVSPGKMVGWGWTVLYLIASLTMNRLGLDGSLYRYGSYPGLNAVARPGAAALDGWFRLYWASFAVLLLVLAQAAWGRGAPGRAAARLAGVPARLGGPAGAVALAALIVFVAIGAHLARRGAF